jgi:DNA-binding GntR family transcriptional regulator
MLPPVPASQTEQLYDRLRAAILSLELAPGERLTERGLEAGFAASRTPVRAALGRLDAEGLVQRDGRGWIVSPIDLAEIGALAELREAVEGAAVRLAVQRASAADIAAVAALLDAARPADNPAANGAAAAAAAANDTATAIGTIAAAASAAATADDDAEQGLRAGGDFHVELTRLSGNPAMVDTVRGAMTRLARTRWLEVRTAAARDQAWREHRAVLDALTAGDADTAARLLTDHIRGTNDRLLTALAADSRRLRGHGLAIV